MKTFVERWTWDEFQLIEDIRSVLSITRHDRFGGNYEPYQVRALDSLKILGCSAKIANKNVSVSLYLRNLKLDFAIQVWEIAQNLTKDEYFYYLDHNWINENDPIKEVVFTNEHRKEAEDYFYQMLKEVCNDKHIVASERAFFRRLSPTDYEHGSLRLEVALNQDEITDDIREKVYKQFHNNKKHYSFDIQNQRFSFDEIKDYFVYCDSHLLSLLNAEDGAKLITEEEKQLFEAAGKSDIDGIFDAIKKGANINAIDKYGYTAFTNVFEDCIHELSGMENPIDRNNQIEQTLSIAKTLLEHGADINLFGFWGGNALKATAYANNPVLMKFLLDNGANPNINFYPEEGDKWLISTPLNVILDHYYDTDKNKREDVEKCEELLRAAGAKDNNYD